MVRLKAKNRTSKSNIKRLERRAHRETYLGKYGTDRGEYRGADCQSCRRWTPKWSGEFSHKQSAGTGGDKGGHVQIQNGIYSCPVCHDVTEKYITVRRELRVSPANCADGGFVQWTEESLAAIEAAHKKNGWMLMKGRPR